MKAGGRLVRLSERGERALFRGYRALDLAQNPFMRARRAAQYRGANSGYVLPMQRRAYQCLNVLGVRIWANKPRQFDGMKWRARRATVARFVEVCEFREFRAWQREGLAPFVAVRRYLPENDSICMTWRNSLEAPDCMPAGGCFDLGPYWAPGGEPPQMVVARGWE